MAAPLSGPQAIAAGPRGRGLGSPLQPLIRERSPRCLQGPMPDLRFASVGPSLHLGWLPL